MRRTLQAALAVATALAATALVAAPVGAGAPTPTITVAPNPAVTGETVTVTPNEPCGDPPSVLQVEVLVDDLDGGDQILSTSADAVTGQWQVTFPAGDVGSYEVTASCVYVRGNDVYRPAPLEVVVAPTTTSTSTTSTTVAPTTSTTAAPAPAVRAAPAFTG